MQHCILEKRSTKNCYPYDRLMRDNKYILSGGNSVYYDAKAKWIRCNGDVLMSFGKNCLRTSVCELIDGKMISDGYVLYGYNGKIYRNNQLLFIGGNHIYYV